MKSKGKRSAAAKTLLSAVLVLVAGYCVVCRLPECFCTDEPALAAAALALTDGTYKTASQPSTTAPAKQTEPHTQKEETAPKVSEPADKKRDKSDYYDSYADHSGESKGEIAERFYSEDGTAVGAAYLKNKTGLSLDFESILNTPLTFNIKKNTKSPQVLIYHTHTSEGYMDEDVDYFYDSFYSRTSDSNFNVVGVGDEIAKALEKQGIGVLHDKTVHDKTYDGSYDRSVQTVLDDMDRNKDIKVVLDIHRDAIGTDECKIKPVFEYSGHKAAQIMIMSGCDTDGERGFDNWQNNLSFALKLQDTAEKLYPGMTRPLDFGYFAYNEYVCDGSLLIEVGTEANSADEVQLTGQLLGNVLAKVLT